jgi:leader peptidase (prepilin peptidase)/N-methyltransferase
MPGSTLPFLVFVIGLLLGTLLNVLIIRLPRERRLLGWPRCTRTGEPLAWWQLLPVVGWLLQRGQASNGRRLHWVYPLIELLTASMLALLFARYGFSATFVYLLFVCAVLIVTGTIDFLYRFIYTFFILGAAVVALIASVAVPFVTLRASALGALAAGIAFLVFFLLAQLLFPGKAAPFGLGDVYLGIFIGAALGLRQLLPALLYGMLIAGAVALLIIVVRLFRVRTPEYIAYGTYLCLGVLLYLVVEGATP